MATSLGSRLIAAASARGKGTPTFSWPSAKYRADPVLFFTEVLGVEPWDRQIEVIESIRDHKRVSVASGHKVSKSHTAGGVALWFYSSFEDARVVMTSTTSRQVDKILWRETKMMHARAGRCAPCKKRDRELIEQKQPPGPRPCPHSALLDGEPGELARTGLRSADFREIVGFTAREAEAVAGVSGKNLLYLIDEASGVPDIIFEAIEGNRAGGARIAMFSNPTRTEGEFYASFSSKAEFYRTHRISSEDTPNVREGREIIPGLATREWVEEKRREWGVESALYKIRVKGEFVLHEDGKIISVHAITESEKRWLDAVPEGRLFLGLDPAGPAQGGDESAFALRRGQKIVALIGMHGLTEEGHLAHVLSFLKQHRLAGDFGEMVPLVVVDREGPIGAAVWSLLRKHAEANPQDFSVVGVRSSEKAAREPLIYDRIRDELWANLARWIRDGGALIPDTKLARELHAPEWVSNIKGQLKVTPKEDLRKLLGRSPDRGDAVTLAVWEPTDFAQRMLAAQASAAPPPAHDARVPTLDPYGGQDTWRRR